MLFSAEELNNDFQSLKGLNISELDIKLEEGLLHIGKASVIRIVGTK